MEEETGTVKMVMSKKKTVKMVKMGVMVAISVAMVYLVHFPIFPAVPFLEYDPADISILIGTFAFGPEAGLVLTVVTAVVQGLTVSAGSGLYGILMHMIATGVLVLVSGMIYNRKKDKGNGCFWIDGGNGCNGSCYGRGKFIDYSDVYGSIKRCRMEINAVYYRLQCDKSGNKRGGYISFV